MEHVYVCNTNNKYLESKCGWNQNKIPKLKAWKEAKLWINSIGNASLYSEKYKPMKRVIGKQWWQ